MNTADRKMTAVPAENHSPHPRCPEKAVKRAATMLLVLTLAGASCAADPPAGSAFFPMGKGQVYEILGDSIGGPHEIFPMIQKAFPGRDLWYLNASFGGNTLRDAVERLDRDALRTDLGPDKDVNWYITMFGANDAALLDAAGKSFPDLLGSCVPPAR